MNEEEGDSSGLVNEPRFNERVDRGNEESPKLSLEGKTSPLLVEANVILLVRLFEGRF